MSLYYESEEKLAQKSAACLQLQTRQKFCTCDLKPGLWKNNTRALVRSLQEDEILEQELKQHMAMGDFQANGSDVGHSLDTQLRIMEDKMSRYGESGSPVYRSVQYGKYKIEYGYHREGINLDGQFNISSHAKVTDSLSSQESVQTVRKRSNYVGVIDDGPLLSVSREGSFPERPYSVAMSDDTTSSKADVLTIDHSLHRSLDRGLPVDIVEEEHTVSEKEDSSEGSHASTSSQSTPVVMNVDCEKGFNSRSESTECLENAKNGVRKEEESQVNMVKQTHLSDHPESLITVDQNHTLDYTQPVVSSNLLDEHPNVTSKKLKPKAISYTFEILPSKVSVHKPKRSKSPQHSSARKSNLASGKSQTKVKKNTVRGNDTATNFRKSVQNASKKHTGGVSSVNHVAVNGNGNLSKKQLSDQLDIDIATKKERKNGASKSANFAKSNIDSKFVNIAKSVDAIANREKTDSGNSSSAEKNNKESDYFGRTSISRINSTSSDKGPTQIDMVSRAVGSEQATRASKTEKQQIRNQDTESKYNGELEEQPVKAQAGVLILSFSGKKCENLIDSLFQMPGEGVSKSLQLEKASEMGEINDKVSRSVNVDSKNKESDSQTNFHNTTYRKDELSKNVAMPLTRSDTYTKERLGTAIQGVKKYDLPEFNQASVSSDNKNVTRKSQTDAEINKDIAESSKLPNRTNGDDTNDTGKMGNIEGVQKQYPFIPHRPTSARMRRREKLDDINRPKTAGTRRLLLSQHSTRSDEFVASATSIKKSLEGSHTESENILAADKNHGLRNEMLGRQMELDEVEVDHLQKTWMTSRRCSTPKPVPPSTAKDNGLANTWSKFT